MINIENNRIVQNLIIVGVKTFLHEYNHEDGILNISWQKNNFKIISRSRRKTGQHRGLKFSFLNI